MRSILTTLKHIASLQAGEDNTYFFSGIFPSYRSHPFFSWVKRPDNNIFFTASSVFILQRLYYLLRADEQKIADAIISRALQSYERFIKHQDGRLYNFYPMSPQSHFTHGHLLSSIKAMELPCDADTTSMAYLTRPESDPAWLKKQLQKRIEEAPVNTNFTLSGYSLTNVYSTWLGSSQMPREYSACVLCNILCWVRESGLPWEKTDEDSLAFIRAVVASGHYMTKPFAVSIHYPYPAQIIYHLARLHEVMDTAFDPKDRKRIMDDAKSLLKDDTRPAMEKLLLTISLMKFGEKQVQQITVSQQELRRYSFFIASFLSYMKSSFFQRLAKYRFFRFEYRCEGFNALLVLEELVLRREKSGK